MAKITRRPNSLRRTVGKNPGLTLDYDCSDVANSLEAGLEVAAFVDASTPDGTTDAGLILADVEVEEDTINDLYLCRVKYTPPEEQENEEEEEDEELATTYSFDSSGGTQHITQGRSVKAYPAEDAPGGAPDFQGAINVNGDNVEGVDVLFPQLKFSINTTRPKERVSIGWIRDVARMTSKTNSNRYEGFEAGELLFTGGSMGQKGAGDYDLRLDFEQSDNITGLSIGNIHGIHKKGHEYLWVFYAPQVDEGASVTVKKPIAAYVHEIYEAGNFKLLS